MSTTCLGPFKAFQFLAPPSDLASAKILVLEEFALEFREITVGLDLVHDDDKTLANMVVEEGLIWRGIVHFVNTASNKKQISREGMQLLANKAQEKNIRIDWEKGVDVVLEGLYWRHTTTLDSVSAPSLRLFIDMKQVASTSGADDYRRFESHLPSLLPEIEKYLDSESFCAIMTAHKGLVTKRNLELFRFSTQLSQGSPEKDDEPVWVRMEDDMSITADQDHTQDATDIDQDLDPNDAPMDLDQVQNVRSPQTDFGPTLDIVELSEDDAGSYKSFPLSNKPSGCTSKGSSDLKSLELISMVPREMFEPVILGQNCQWYCPIRQCQFSLNLRSTLPYKMLQQLDSDDKLFLQRSSWTSRSPIAANILNKMSSCHYLDHLQQLGLTISSGQIRRLN
ncbi:hypothetical protein CPB86DRAFT_809680 [Serendipita vermifera]|nr:hypothetical protein CPB86DRAFT_809680 [Serendipita vermifera]